MADEKDDKLQSENQEIRKALNDAYAAVEGNKAVQSFSAVTYEDLLDQQIQRIEGADTETRPNELHRIDKVLANVLSAIEKVKARPPESFVEARQDKDVNTKP